MLITLDYVTQYVLIKQYCNMLQFGCILSCADDIIILQSNVVSWVNPRVARNTSVIKG